MQKKPSPDLSSLCSTLARDSAGMDRAVDSMTRRIDTMVVAVRREDWNAVSEISHRLAQNAREEGYRAISAMAQRVCAEAAKSKNAVGIKRSLIRLVGAQGRVPHGTGV